MAPLGEENGDDQDREELPDGTRGVHMPAELAAEHRVITQDRQQHAQRRGGKGQPYRHVVLDVARGAQPGHGPHRNRGRDQPADDTEPARALPEQPRVQLEPGEQEQKAEPDIGQQLDAGRLGQAQPMRADQDAAKQENDDLRDARARQHRNHERRKRGHQRHGHQVFQPRVRSMIAAQPGTASMAVPGLARCDPARPAGIAATTADIVIADGAGLMTRPPSS